MIKYIKCFWEVPAMKPLEGITIVELGVYVAVPNATRQLSDWGAKVIKVESPTGERGRVGGAPLNLPIKPDCNPYFCISNSGKEMVCLDLKNPDGLAVMENLLKKADVFASNFRYGSLERMGLDYESLHKRFPKLVCAYFNGYGFEGPEKDRPGYDTTAFWSKAGILNHIREPGVVPHTPPGGIGDTAAASNMAAGILAALIHRDKTGKGTCVTSSLLAAGIWCNAVQITAGQDRQKNDGNEPIRAPISYKQWKNPFSHIYECKDGKMFYLIGGGGAKLHTTLKTIGLGDLTDDPRYADYRSMRQNSGPLYARMIELFKTKTAQEWLEIFDSLDAPCEILLSNYDVSTDEQVLANEYLANVTCPNGYEYLIPNSPVRFSCMEKPQTLHAHAIGEDTHKVLADLGYTMAQIQDLTDRGIIR